MKNNQDTAQTPSDILRELKSLVSEAETMIASSVSDQSSEAIDALRERFNAAQESLSEAYEGARNKVIAGAKYTDTRIRENPYQAMAIVLGVGMLVGVLLGRRSK